MDNGAPKVIDSSSVLDQGLTPGSAVPFDDRAAGRSPDKCHAASVTTPTVRECSRQYHSLTPFLTLKENNMWRNTFALGLIVAVMSAAAVAQMGPASPAPELKKLDYFAGNWTIEATIGSGPWGAGGKFTATGAGEWMKGNFFLVSHSDFSLPPELGGSGTGLSVRTYDPDKKVYTDETFNNDGRREVMTGTLNGDTWIWTGEANYSGMTIEQRMTLKVTSPTSYTTKYEVSADSGATWMPFWDGKANKK